MGAICSIPIRESQNYVVVVVVVLIAVFSLERAPIGFLLLKGAHGSQSDVGYFFQPCLGLTL